jgi:hypothetical protein
MVPSYTESVPERRHHFIISIIVVYETTSFENRTQVDGDTID